MIYSILVGAISSVLMIISVLAVPKIKIKGYFLPIYWVFPFLGALLLILTNNISFFKVAERLTESTAINPIKILILFISMTALSVFLDEVGFFSYIATVVLNKAKTSQIRLFIYFYLITSVLTVFTSNDIIILTFTPFICYLSKRAKINPIPYLISEFVSANTWSMMFIIGNPTNVYLAQSLNVTFFKYFSVMVLPTVLAGLLSFLILFLIFRKSLNKEIERTEEKAYIKDKVLTVTGIIILGCCTILLAVANYIGIEMWLICLISASLLFVIVGIYKLIKKEKPTELLNTVKRAPWILIPFVLSMFVLVLALEENGVLKEIAEFFGKDYTIIKYGYTSFLTANLINNIPMSVLFSSLLKCGVAPTLKAMYSAVIGSNIGAYLTPIGALAGIMWINILSKQDIKFSFKSFIKYGIIVGVPTMTIALLGLTIVS